MAYTSWIHLPGLGWRVLVAKSRLNGGFFGQVDLSSSLPSNSHSLDLFSSRNFSPKLSILACKVVAIPHIYCSWINISGQTHMRIEDGSQEAPFQASFILNPRPLLGLREELWGRDWGISQRHLTQVPAACRGWHFRLLIFRFAVISPANFSSHFSLLLPGCHLSSNFDLMP